ncbi:MAG TPA: zf-HC2 domain-containing protein [Blastocatellia bacterium]
MTADKHPEEKLFAHLNGSLGSAEDSEVHLHLDQCPECRTVATVIKQIKQSAQANVLVTGGHAGNEDRAAGYGGPAGCRPAAGSSAGRPRPAPLALGDIDGSLKPEIPGLESEEMWPVIYQHEDAIFGHPSTHDLACFFYWHQGDCEDGEPGQRGLPGLMEVPSETVAGHIAMCRECSEYLSDFAKAEAAATDFSSHEFIGHERPAATASAAEMGFQIPARAWEMISKWQESDFAKPRPEGETLDAATLEMLLRLLSERRREIHEMAQKDLIRCAERAAGVPIVPVVIVDRKGELCGVELFRNVKYDRGAQVLESVQDSNRYEDRMIHALLDYGNPNPSVASDRIRGGVARLTLPLVPRRADYFIIEQ